MSENENNVVGRTLVITWGALAKAAGERLAQLLPERQGPETAVAIIHLPESEANGDDFTARLAAALTRISPPNLAGLLAQSGWQLRPGREIQLALVVDAVAGADQAAQWIGQTAVDMAYRQLGVESQVTLLWLAPDMDEAAESCLQTAASFSYAPTILALNPINEAGLRLPAPETLGFIGAEVLWSLCATPFYDFLRGVFSDVDQIYTGAPSLASLGISVWAWSPTAVHESFVRRWQQTVLDHWLAEAGAEPAAEAIAAWIEQQGLDKASLLAGLVAERDVPLPAYGLIARHFPWPWDVPGQINRLKTLFQVDSDDVAGFSKQAAQALAVKREQTAAQISAYLAAALDEQPIAGIAATARWTWALAAAFEAAYEQMLDEAAVYDGIDNDLAVERGLIEARIRDLLADWPGAQWRRWLRVAGWFWRWPRLGWRYWQLRQLGLRLAGLLAQQSIRLREQAGQAVVAKLMAELARLARQEHSRVAEIGEMLASLREAIGEKEEMRNEKEEELEIRNEMEEDDEEMETDVVLLPIPDDLYGRLLTDSEQEAVLAAEAIGGLGQQLRQLDDAIRLPLAKLARERVASVWTLTAVDILEALLPTADNWQTWQQLAWQAATPLWRYDEGQLSETARRDNWTGACVIGAGVERLAAILADPAAPILPDDGSLCHWLASSDRCRLIVIRLRRGLAAGEEIRREK